MSELTVELVLEIMKEYDYPVTAAWIASCAVNKTGNGEIKKKHANSLLYKMQKEKLVKKLECKPPLWKAME